MSFYSQFSKDHLIFAHRGLRSEAPENTLLAFEKGLGRTDCFEVDVQLTRDGVPVVVHDDLLTRTTDILFHPTLYTCKHWNIHQFSFEELQLLDAGSWFLNQDPFGFLEEGRLDIKELAGSMPQSIPTLKEVLAFAKEHQYPINIEIKVHARDDVAYYVKKVLDDIHGSECKELVIVSSFDHDVIAHIKELDTSIATAALMEELPSEELIPYLKTLQVEALHVKHTLVEKLPLEILSKEGILVSVYTVNDLRYMEMLFDLGIKGVFSDVAS